eukprot:SAG31_NODE_426_length_15814_cov_25.737066_9_plen_1416_part_00
MVAVRARVMEWALYNSTDHLTDRRKQQAVTGDTTALPPPLAEIDVYTLGENKFGQLGVSDDVIGARCIREGSCTEDQWLSGDRAALAAARNTLVQPPHSLYGDYVVSVSCAENQTILLTFHGSVFTCGENQSYNLGLGDAVEDDEKVNELTLVEIEPEEAASSWKIKKVVISGHHSIAISNIGDVYGWGDGTEGQLGYAGISRRKRPPGPTRQRKPVFDLQLAPLERRKNLSQAQRKAQRDKNIMIRDVSVGSAHTAFITAGDGKVYMQGLNNYGQLGYGRRRNEWLPRHVLHLSGTIVKQVACGFYHTLFLTSNREVFVTGLNNSGQLGTEGDFTDDQGNNMQEQPKINLFFDGLSTAQVSCGAFHSAIMTDCGDIYTFGDGSVGQLGHGDKDDVDTPTLVKIDDEIDGTHHAFMEEVIMSIHCGDFNTLAVALSGRVYEWGAVRDKEYNQPTALAESCPAVKDKFVIQASSGEVHCGYLVVRELKSHHRACQNLLHALKTILRDFRLLNHNFQRPLHDKLMLAKPLLRRDDIAFIFHCTDELEEFVVHLTDYVQSELSRGDKGKGFKGIASLFVDDDHWDYIQGQYRELIGQHARRLRRLRSMKTKRSGLRKFLKQTKRETGVGLADALLRLLSHPERFMAIFNVLEEMAPDTHQLAAEKAECAMLIRTADDVLVTIGEEQQNASKAEKCLVGCAESPCFGSVFCIFMSFWLVLADFISLPFVMCGGGRPYTWSLWHFSKSRKKHKKQGDANEPAEDSDTGTDQSMYLSTRHLSFKHLAKAAAVMADDDDDVLKTPRTQAKEAEESSKERKAYLLKKKGTQDGPTKAELKVQGKFKVHETITAYMKDGSLLVTMNWKLVVISQIIRLSNDCVWLCGQILDIFGREALGDLGQKTATTLALIFMMFPLFWSVLIGPTGAIGKVVFQLECMSSNTSATSINSTNATNTTSTDSFSLECDAGFYWLLPWFFAYLGLTIFSVFLLLFKEWWKQPEMYDCPSFAGFIRPTWINRSEIIFFILGYGAFFSISMNTEHIDWSMQDELRSIFPSTLLAYWQQPCKTSQASNDFWSPLCDLLDWLDYWKLLILTLCWAISFRLAAELPSGKLDDFVTHTVVPLLADWFYMIIVQACLDQLDCSNIDGKWILDADGETQCWTGSHAQQALIAITSFGLYFPVATTSGVLMQPDDERLDINFKPIWDIILKLGEFCLVFFSVFLSGSIWANSILLLIINLVLVILHCVNFGKWQDGRSVSPVSNSNFINKLGTFLLTASLWSIICGMIQISRKPTDPETDYTDSLPLVLLIIGMMIDFLAVTLWYVLTTTDKFVTRQKRKDVIKTWVSQMKSHDGENVHPDELAANFAKKLINRGGLRYSLFPDHEKQPPVSLLERMRAHAAGDTHETQGSTESTVFQHLFRCD